MISYDEALKGWRSRETPPEPKAQEMLIPLPARVVDALDTRHRVTNQRNDPSDDGPPDSMDPGHSETPEEPLVPAFELEWRKKRLKVLRMLDDPEGAKLSSREIARRLGVTHGFVNKLRRSRRRLFEQTVSLT
jgi:hypothetical protein